jgi:hypothetical protein
MISSGVRVGALWQADKISNKGTYKKFNLII